MTPVPLCSCVWQLSRTTQSSHDPFNKIRTSTLLFSSTAGNGPCLVPISSSVISQIGHDETPSASVILPLSDNPLACFVITRVLVNAIAGATQLILSLQSKDSKDSDFSSELWKPSWQWIIIHKSHLQSGDFNKYQLLRWPRSISRILQPSQM